MEFLRGSRAGRRRGGSHDVVVLAYHAVADLSDDALLSEYGVPPDRLAAQLDALRAHRWQFVDLDAVRAALRGERSLPNRSVLVTFDDGYADLLSDGCPILTAREVPAVAFAITNRIGGDNDWDGPRRARPLALLDEGGLRRLVEAGLTVGSHGATHTRLTELTPDQLEAELLGSAERLQAIGLDRPFAFSYPYGVWSPDVAESVRDAGYELAFTVDPGVARRGESRYALPRVEVFAADGPRTLRVKMRTAGWPRWIRRRLLRLLGAKP
jgi:peptidoglycan/xylan/chitin deacetylase (PgdA/CDA1 family)